MLNFPNALQHLKIYWKKLLYCTRMQLFIDWKVATNHWKPDCSIHGSWTPMLGTGLGQDTTMKTCTSSLMFLMAGPRFTSHHPGLSRPSTDFIVKVRCHPPGPRNRLGGRQRTPGTVTQSRTCSSAPALAYLRARAKGTRHLSIQSRSGSTFPLVDSQADNAPMKICLASAMKVYVWGLSVYTESIEPAVQSWSGWKPFCSVGAAQSFLGGFTGGVFYVAPLWLFTLLMNRREGEEVTDPFIQAF